MKRRSLNNPFPPPESASPEGVVAVGAEPHPELLKIAYQQGIFPWPHRDMPLLWFSPDPRFVLIPEHAHLHRSLRKVMRKDRYRVTADTAFDDVMEACKDADRPGQDGTWITDEMIVGYTQLHDEGIAHSIEAWDDSLGEAELVGGLYGVSFGRAFFGESMFARAPDASKVAFGTLIGQLLEWDFHFIDCQTYTDHLARFGSEDMPREDFLELLHVALDEPGVPGPWTLDVTPARAVELLEAQRRERADG
jgi:leucyl/phenylalanyl-tRNA--protein transferase